MGRQVCMVLADHLGHPWPFSPPRPSLLGKLPEVNQILLARAWSFPSLLPSPDSIHGKANSSSGASLFSPCSPWGVRCEGQTVTAHTGTCGRAPRLPSTPALCPPWLLGRRHPQEVGGVEMSPGLGVTQSLGGIRQVHGEYILTETWECVPSPFTTRSGTHRSLKHPSSV